MPVFRFVCPTCGKSSDLGASNARTAQVAPPPRNEPYDLVFLCERCGAEHVCHLSAEKVEALRAKFMPQGEPDEVPSSSTQSDTHNDDGCKNT